MIFKIYLGLAYYSLKGVILLIYYLFVPAPPFIFSTDVKSANPGSEPGFAVSLK